MENIYFETADKAIERGELEQFRISKKANIECSEAIDHAIAENFYNFVLNKGFEADLIATYGIERVTLICAFTVANNEYDGRYSFYTKKWAKSFIFPLNFKINELFLRSHPVLIDTLINRLRKIKS
jgi:hypothetical protein